MNGRKVSSNEKRASDGHRHALGGPPRQDQGRRSRGQTGERSVRVIRIVAADLRC